MRSLTGFRLMEMRPLFRVVLMPSAPMNEDRLSTAGSCRMILRQLLLLFRHGIEGDGLRCLRDALNHAGILHREKSLGNEDVEQDGEHERCGATSSVTV